MGYPGSGKTTLLKWVAWKTAKESRPNKKFIAPVYIPLRRYHDMPGDDPFLKLMRLFVEQLILLHSITSYPGVEKTQNLLQRAPFLFLFDGLNEIVATDETKNDIEEVAMTIRLICELFPQSRYILTSRKYQQEEKIIKALKPQVVFDIRELSFDQAQEFIKKYDSDIETKLLSFSDLPPRLRKMGQTPLYLSFIIELSQMGTKFADSPIGIIFDIMHKRLEWENISFSTVSTVKHRSPKSLEKDFPGYFVKKQALISLAKLAQKSKGVIRYNDPSNQSESALQMITNLTGDQKVSKELIIGWCKKDLLYFDGDYLEFWHPVFQAYLLSEELAEELDKLYNKDISEFYVELKKVTRNWALHEILSMSVALVDPEIAKAVLTYTVGEDIILAGMCLNNLPSFHQDRIRLIQKFQKVYRIVRIDWFGFPIFVLVVAGLLLIILPKETPLISSLFYYLHNSISDLAFIGSLTTLGIFLEALRIIYSQWVNKVYISPISVALGHLHFPESADMLNQIINASQYYVIEGSSETALRAKLENVDTLDDLREALLTPATANFAIAELAKRGNEKTIRILLELLEETMNSWGTYKYFGETVVANLLLVPRHKWLLDLMTQTLRRFYQQYPELITWKTRIDLYKFLKTTNSKVLALPYPRLSEIISLYKDTGFRSFFFVKIIVVNFILFLLIAVFWQLSKWILR